MSDKRPIKQTVDYVIYPGGSKKLRQDKFSKSTSTSLSKTNTSAVLDEYDFVPSSLSSKQHELQYETPSVDNLGASQHFQLDWVDLDHEARKNNAYPHVDKSKTNQAQKILPNLQQIIKPILNQTQDKIITDDKRSQMSSTYLVNDSSSIELGGQGTDWYDDPRLDGQLIDTEVPNKSPLEDEFNQLDEPILDTLLRDLNGIFSKMKIIALPLSSYDIYKIVFRGWDLWGPLLLCTFLAFSLHDSGTYIDAHSGFHFADVFVLVWFGSGAISLSYRLLSLSSMNDKSNLSNQTTLTSGDNSIVGDELIEGLEQIHPPQEKSASGSTSIMMMPDNSSFKTLLSPPSIFQLMCVFGYCLVSPSVGLILLKLFSHDKLLFERIVIGLLICFAWPTICANRILLRYQRPDKRAIALYPIGLFYFMLSCMIILGH